MKYFNIYYKEQKINNRPLTQEQLDEVLKTNEIHKRNNITNKLESIPVNKLNVIKTIIL